MTLYNPIKDVQGSTGLILQMDTTAYIFGLFFTVTSNCYINGIWWFCDVAGDQYNNNLGDEQIALWTVNGYESGSYVSGSVVTAGTYVNGWNLISFGSPIALTAGTEYCAVKGISSFAGGNQNYTAYGDFFESGHTGGAGFSEGPVNVYSSGFSGQLGSSNTEPYGNGQQGFFVGGTSSAHPPSVTTYFPNSTFNGGWYGMDVQIATSAALSGPKLPMASFP